MFLAFLKFGDIGARSLFVLMVLYSLPLEASGQFGLLLTVLTFWSFFAGFERYLDIQRSLVSESDIKADNIVLDNLRFYGFNLLLLFPIVFVLLMQWTGLSYLQIALIPVIAFAEHQSTEIYRYALIVPRYRGLLWIVLVKGLVLLGAISVPVLAFETALSLNTVIVTWALISVIFLVIGVVGFVKRPQQQDATKLPHFWSGWPARLKASRVHFAIGLLALLSLQADRLIVGGLLSLEQAGIYFRHVFLAMSIYQVLTVISYNRILSSVYRLIRMGEIVKARTLLRVERAKVIIMGLVVVALISIVASSDGFAIPQIQALVPFLLAGLMLAIVFRALADYNAIVLNAFRCERYIFRAHGIALAISMILNLGLTWTYGLAGTVVAVVSGAVIYFLVTARYAGKRYEMGRELG